MMNMIILKVKVGDNCDNLASGPWTEGYGTVMMIVSQWHVPERKMMMCSPFLFFED
jgi:hypothetical protein